MTPTQVWGLQHESPFPTPCGLRPAPGRSFNSVCHTLYPEDNSFLFPLEATKNLTIFGTDEKQLNSVQQCFMSEHEE